MKTKSVLQATVVWISAASALWGAGSEVPSLPSNNEGVVVYKSGNWSTTQATIGTWLRYDSGTGAWIESTGADAQPKESETVVIGRESTGSFTLFQYEDGNTVTEVNSVFFEAADNMTASRDMTLRLGNNNNYDISLLRIKNDLVVTNSSNKGGLTVRIYPQGKIGDNQYSYSSLDIGGNVYVGNDTSVKNTTLLFGNKGDTDGLLGSLRIGGDVYVREYTNAKGQLYFNVGDNFYSELKGGALYDISNPDVEIGGAIHVVGDQRNFFYMMQNDGGRARVCTFSVGGLDGNFSFLLSNGTPTDYNDGENVNYFVLVLTQGAGITYTHHTTAELGATIGENGDNNFDAANVMKIVMQGEGTQILKSGTLRFHGGVEVNNGTLLVNGKAVGADGKAIDQTIWTHGDLEMNGGTFGMYNNTAGAGIFTFSNCYWKDGTIQLGTYDGGVDVLSFDGAFMEGAGEVSDVWFSFDGDCSALLEQRKLIDCSEFSSYFTEDKFKADDAFIFGEMYKAQFEIKDDGLYMQYVAIPEPAFIAALLGLCACLIAFAKRGRSA